MKFHLSHLQAMLLFALATWILIMAWMSRYSHLGGTYPQWPSRG